MKAVILAAGTASRLKPLTNNTPKCLLRLGTKTILERTIDSLLHYNINDLVIVTGYLEKKIRDFIEDKYSKVNVQYFYNDKYRTTNNIYSLWMTQRSVQDSHIILMDSDIVFDHQIIRLLLNAGPGNFLTVRSDHQLGTEEMKVITSSENEVIKISKEIDPAAAAGESIGIEKFEPDYLKILFDILNRRIVAEKKVNDFYELAFQEAIDSGQSVKAVDVGKLRCIEVDTPEDLEEAEKQIIKYLD